MYKDPGDYIGPTKILSPSQGQLFSNLLSSFNLNFSLPCNITYSQVLDIGMWDIEGGKKVGERQGYYSATPVANCYLGSFKLLGNLGVYFFPLILSPNLSPDF